MHILVLSSLCSQLSTFCPFYMDSMRPVLPRIPSSFPASHSPFGEVYMMEKHNKELERKLLLFCFQVMSESATEWTVTCQAPLSSTVSRSLLKFVSIEPVMLSNHLILCRPLLLLPSISPSIRIFYNVTPLRKAYMSCTNPSGNI